MQIKKQQLEKYVEQWTSSKLGKGYIKAVYCHPAYLSYMQNTSHKMLGWMKHKLESRLLREISITSDMLQSLPHVLLFATPWSATCQASLSITNSWSFLRLMSIESVMPSNHLILCHLLLPSIFPSIRVFYI